nr:hypothetical protein BgiMline_005057 [Biomphalaria glabrata]
MMEGPTRLLPKGTNQGSAQNELQFQCEENEETVILERYDPILLGREHGVVTVKWTLVSGAMDNVLVPNDGQRVYG